MSMRTWRDEMGAGGKQVRACGEIRCQPAVVPGSTMTSMSAGLPEPIQKSRSAVWSNFIQHVGKCYEIAARTVDVFGGDIR